VVGALGGAIEAIRAKALRSEWVSVPPWDCSADDRRGQRLPRRSSKRSRTTMQVLRSTTGLSLPA
jgi:hypothetical protein